LGTSRIRSMTEAETIFRDLPPNQRLRRRKPGSASIISAVITDNSMDQSEKIIITKTCPELI